MPRSVNSYFESDLPAKLAANPDIARSIGNVVEFQICGSNGGTWTVDCTGDGVVVEGSTGNANTTVICGDADFCGILDKRTNAQMMFMSGRLKVKGEMRIALMLHKIL